MGEVVQLECPACGIKKDYALSGCGFEGLKYAPAWCVTCKNFVSAHIEGGWRVDRSRLCKCPHCSGEVSLFDMDNPICPICGTVMEVSYTSLWD